MPDPAERLPATDKQKGTDATGDDQMMDPQDLVYSGGFVGNPREIVENPAVAPEMLNSPSPDFLRDDLVNEELLQEEQTMSDE